MRNRCSLNPSLMGPSVPPVVLSAVMSSTSISFFVSNMLTVARLRAKAETSLGKPVTLPFPLALFHRARGLLGVRGCP